MIGRLKGTIAAIGEETALIDVDAESDMRFLQRRACCSALSHWRCGDAVD